MKKKLFTLTMSAIVLPILLLTGCGQKESASEINIGYFNNVTHAQALYMKATGSFEETLSQKEETAATKVNWISFNAGPAEVEALMAGSIDIGYIGPVPAVTANLKSKGDIVVISSATKGGAVLVTNASSGINSISDLAGKTISVPQIGNTQHLCLMKLLEDNNLADVNNGGNVTIAAVANADVANMMDQNNIDAAIVPEPWGATLLSKGANLLLDYDEVYPGGDNDVAVVVVRKDFLNAFPDIVSLFLEEHQTATDTINGSSDTYSVINEEIFAATEKHLDDAILNEAFSRIAISTELNVDSLFELARISKDNGIINDMPVKETLIATVK